MVGKTEIKISVCACGFRCLGVGVLLFLDFGLIKSLHFAMW